jgi:hypothetical protein
MTNSTTSSPAHRGDRPTAVAGVAFLVLLLLGNSLSLSGVDELADPTDAQLQAALLQQSTGAVNQLGVTLELLAFVALALLVGRLSALLRHTAGWGTTVAVAGATVLGVKLASASPLLVAMSSPLSLEPALARVLVDLNDAAFVVSWLPMAVVVGAAAWGARQAGLTGRVLTGTGLALAALGLAAALLGVRDLDTAVPVPFLLSLLWLTALAVRLGRNRPVQGELPAARVPAQV